MADRINGMRAELKNKLVNDLGSKNNWDHITNQIGMYVTRDAFFRVKLESLRQVCVPRHLP